MRQRIQKVKGWRWVLLAFSLLYTIVMLLGSTLSWITSSGSALNELDTGELQTVIQQMSTNDLQWKAGSTVAKQLRIYNTGTTAAIVRVKLTEHFLSFQFDNTNQNGAMVTQPNPAANMVDYENTASWMTGATYEHEGRYLIGDKAILNYDFGPQRETTELRYIELTQPSMKITVDISASDYWLYEDGWFYYSEILQPGEATTALITSMKLADDLPQKYKLALYHMDVDHSGVAAASTSLGAWGLSSGNAYSMLRGKLNRY